MTCVYYYYADNVYIYIHDVYDSEIYISTYIYLYTYI